MDAIARGPINDETEEHYRLLENEAGENGILDVNERTAFPPDLSDSGDFEPGDLRAFLRERAATPADPTGSAFDRMSALDQWRFIRQNAPDYEQMRSQEIARHDGRRVAPGAAGDALGEVMAFVAMGLPSHGEEEEAAPAAERPSERRTGTLCETCNAAAAESNAPRTGQGLRAPPEVSAEEVRPEFVRGYSARERQMLWLPGLRFRLARALAVAYARAPA
jgi:hypothetical protein